MKTKMCKKCGKRKSLSKFHKHKVEKDGFRTVCKKCRRRIDLYYRIKHKNKINNRNKQYYLKFPWKRTLVNIKTRCNNPKNPDYKNWGGRGIKCLITEEELKKLWFRDKAYLMKQPTIDKINNDNSYTYKNCRYIERIKNIKRRFNKQK